MGRRLACGSLALLGSLFALRSSAADDDAASLIGVGERLLILAPHPDDETLGAAGLAQRVLAQAGSVRTVIFTAGDGFVEAVQQRTGKRRPDPEAYLSYGEQRIREAQTVANVIGAGRIRLDVLGFPDGGLLPLLLAHWGLPHPERSSTTNRFTQPYREGVDRYLAYSGRNLHFEILRILRETRPTIIAFTDPLDEHPDHRAVGLFGLLATNDYMRGRAGAWPRLFSYLVHWRHWPPDSGGTEVPKQIVDKPLPLPEDLPSRGQTRACLTLSDQELTRKQAALSEYRTQLRVMPVYLLSYVRRTECFSLNTPSDANSVGVEIRNQALAPRSGKVARP
ncbi:MAG TPA: PIG-L family deacetylase [Polyangiales bacterium]|jgi:LmbE family N-acetylglucosaminyl deacetylase|nr:PIG-L family deacetylase [Polyangiales bacterium]